MIKEEILENLKKYLQFLLDNGTHKIFYNNLFWCEKTIDCINAINDLQQENKQLKEQLENDIDKYEDTISYQLGFDKGKEYLQQRIDKAKEYIKYNLKSFIYSKEYKDLMEILGDKENEENIK